MVEAVPLEDFGDEAVCPARADDGGGRPGVHNDTVAVAVARIVRLQAETGVLVVRRLEAEPALGVEGVERADE
eukprot:2154532-Alexandrium_andersonii.AAC.1